MKKRWLTALFIVMLWQNFAAAQSGGQFAITQSVIAGGGGGANSDGGNFGVTGTTAQPSAAPFAPPPAPSVMRVDASRHGKRVTLGWRRVDGASRYRVDARTNGKSRRLVSTRRGNVTVAIDWAYASIGAVGEDVAPLLRPRPA